MDFLPIAIRIKDARILIVGGGKVATHKAQILNRFTDEAIVVGREISDGIRKLPFKAIEKDFEETDLEGVNLLFVCTGDHELNHRIKELARQKGILTSVCDDPEACDFISPAIYRQDNLTIAVGSDSKDVKRSIRVRNRIQESIENQKLSLE